MADQPHLDQLIALVEDERYMFNLFMEGVAKFFETHPKLKRCNPPAVHSVKSRIKDPSHLKDKIMRYQERHHELINEANIFREITDIAGVRVLHLYQEQLRDINSVIVEHVDAGEWVFEEPPKAYSWDPDSSDFFKSLGLEIDIKQSHYTSVHYLVRPRKDAKVCCEIQVRTLLEELWGEIDHTLNYPKSTNNLAIKEQLRVLAKLVATGSRLADGIFRIQEYENAK